MNMPYRTMDILNIETNTFEILMPFLDFAI